MQKTYKLTLVWLTSAMMTAATARASLITNGDFEAGNAGFAVSSAYQYSATTDQGPGDYGVITNPNAYGSGFFSIGDHTSGSGKMLFIDAAASSDPPAVFWSETINVSPNTNYVFSGFAREVGSYPNAALIRASDGTSTIGPDFQLSLGSATGSWESFSETFNSGAESSILLTLSDANTNALAGNDFVIDDLSVVQQVPEPSSAALALAGVIGCLCRRHRSKNIPMAGQADNDL
jgi:hypothetical protein